jgi:hypothetical protein
VLRRWSCLVLGIALAALSLSACGGGSGSQGTSSEATSTHYEGGEKSIENFGSEASGDSRAAVLAAFHGYLGAVAARDYPKACAYLAASVKQSLEQFSKGRLKGCEELLPKLLSPTAPVISREQDEGRVTKVRVQGDRAFVVYHAPGAKLYQLTMSSEDGEWKTDVVGGAVLVPSAATLGQ